MVLTLLVVFNVSDNIIVILCELTTTCINIRRDLCIIKLFHYPSEDNS
jgi:hypothetical protein